MSDKAWPAPGRIPRDAQPAAGTSRARGPCADRQRSVILPRELRIHGRGGARVRGTPGRGTRLGRERTDGGAVTRTSMWLVPVTLLSLPLVRVDPITPVEDCYCNGGSTQLKIEVCRKGH